jgi:AhpC/TSA family protein
MKNMRIAAVITWLIILSGIIITLFWYNEWVYALPTPVPSKYKPVNTGEEIFLSAKFQPQVAKPLFLHFFNPDCPCSKFNISHFKSLVKQYSDKVTFVIVVLSNKPYTAKQILDKFSLNTTVLFDSSIAISCGVYSTPQAVIIDGNHKLYYRGNYNRSRYCTDQKTNYAQMALDALLNNDRHIIFNQYALQAYGCQLPNCTR